MKPAMALILAATACDAAQRGAAPNGVEDADAQRAERPACVDVGVPAGTAFPFVLSSSPSARPSKTGDEIVIKEVRGDRRTLEQGGMYEVKGSYTLASADEAALLLSVTAKRRDEGCTIGSAPRARVIVSRGRGDFELATLFPYEGEPHVTFYVEGRNAGGVYFGSADRAED